MGSSSTGSHFGMASLIAMRAAVLNAWSELSTAWNWPVIRFTETSTTGKPSGPVAQIVPHAFLDRGDVVARNGAADHRIDEGVAGAARQRLHLDLDVGELAVAAALALEAGMLAGAACGWFPCRAPAAGAW